jgi:hypothetical protein
MAPLLLRGAHTQLTLDTLGPINDDFDSRRMWAAGAAHRTRLTRPGRWSWHPLLCTPPAMFPATLLVPALPTVLFSLAQMAQPPAIHAAIAFLTSYSTPVLLNCLLASKIMP